MMKRKFAIIGSLFVMLGVILGAFGAHALRDLLGAAGTITWKTAVLYQFVHGLALLAISGYVEELPLKKIRWTLLLFSLGNVLFSGSLYILATASNSGLRAVMGPLTPLGGLSFILGWLVFIYTLIKNK